MDSRGIDRNVGLPKLAYSLREAAETIGVSLATIRGAIDKGDLITRYPSPRRPVIPASELQAWLERLPTEPPVR